MATENKDLRFRILASIVGGEAINKFRTDVDKTAKSADKLKLSASDVANGVKNIAGAFVVAETVSFAKGLINVADEMDELSEKTGVAVETLAAFAGMAEVENVSVQELTANLKKLSSATIEAATGNKEYLAVFKTLGVEIKDGAGKIRNSGDILKDISDSFSKMENGALKSTLAVKLFGKSGTDFIPFLNKGSEEIQRFGMLIDEDFALRAGAFNDTISEMSIRTKNGLLVGLKEVLPVLQEVLDAFNTKSDNDEGIADTFQVIGEVIRITVVAVNGFVDAFVQGFDTVVTMGKAGGAIIMDLLATIGDGVSTRARQLKDLVTLDFETAGRRGDGLEARAKQRAEQTAKEREKLFDDFVTRSEKRAEKSAKVNEKLLKNSLLFGEGTEAEILKRQREATKPAGAANGGTEGSISELAKAKSGDRDRVKEFIEQQKLENRQRKEALADITLTRIELLKTVEARALEAEAIKYGKTLNEEQRRELMLATEEITKQREEIIQLEYDQKRTYQTGAREYLRTYLEDVTNNANSVKQVLSTTFGAMEDTLVNFVKTGKMNFKNFADAVISEIIRIAVRQAVIAPIVGAFTGALSGAAGAGASAGGGAGGYAGGGGNAGAYASYSANGNIITKDGPMPLRKYANGGVANSPHVAIFGEGTRPEAFVPLPDGRTIPVTMKGGNQGGGDTNVSISVSVESSGKESGSVEADKQTGKAFGLVLKNVVLNTIVEQKRPGGLLATV